MTKFEDAYVPCDLCGAKSTIRFQITDGVAESCGDTACECGNELVVDAETVSEQTGVTVHEVIMS